MNTLHRDDDYYPQVLEIFVLVVEKKILHVYYAESLLSITMVESTRKQRLRKIAA